MTRRRARAEAGPDPADPGFDFSSPRWREAEPSGQGPANKQRRFRNDVAPGQRGSIDAGGSVPRSGEEGPKRHVPRTKPRDLLR
jgi:hypothetical protein